MRSWRRGVNELSRGGYRRAGPGRGRSWYPYRFAGPATWPARWARYRYAQPAHRCAHIAPHTKKFVRALLPGGRAMFLFDALAPGVGAGGVPWGCPASVEAAHWHWGESGLTLQTCWYQARRPRPGIAAARRRSRRALPIVTPPSSSLSHAGVAIVLPTWRDGHLLHAALHDRPRTRAHAPKG